MDWAANRAVILGGVRLAPEAVSFSVVSLSSITAGNALTITVTALDANSAATTNYTGTVHLTSSDAQATLGADNTLTNGIGTFSVTLKTAGTQVITATDTVTASITGSKSVTVSAGALALLAVTGPASVTSASPATFTVRSTDSFGNTVTSYAGSVHFTSSDGSATLPSDGTLTSGVGTFSVTLVSTGTQTVTATDTVTNTITGNTTTSVAIHGSDTFTANGTWTCPAGVTAVAIECWGGGGGGSGSKTAGGGGGAYSKKNTYAVTPGNMYAVVVGAGGLGGGIGIDGGDTYFVDVGTVLAKGGKVGFTSAGAGGASASGVGDVKFSGGDGAT